MAESQYGSPIYIPENGAVRVLGRETLGNKGGDAVYDEGWLQNLLFEYPEAVPFPDIDQAFSDAIPVCIELNTPAGPLDVLYVTPKGKLIILEAKLWSMLSFRPQNKHMVILETLMYCADVGPRNIRHTIK